MPFAFRRPLTGVSHRGRGLHARAWSIWRPAFRPTRTRAHEGRGYDCSAGPSKKPLTLSECIRSAVALCTVGLLVAGCAGPQQLSVSPTRAPEPSATPRLMATIVPSTPASVTTPVSMATQDAPAAVSAAPTKAAKPAAVATAVSPTAWPQHPPAKTSTVLPSPTRTLAATPTPPASPPAVASLSTQSWTEWAAGFQRGQMAGVALAADQGIQLAGAPGSYSGSGEYLSQVLECAFPFSNAVLSWNADAPSGTALRFELRVRDGSGWSGWYAMGEWRANGGRSIPGQADARGRVDVDTLKLNSVAMALQYRVELSSDSPATTPLLRQVSVVYSDLSHGLIGPALPRPAGAVRDLDVPQHSQLEENPSYASQICSATSLAMVMQYWGLKKSVADVVAGVRDQTTGIYGNWPLNMAFAGANGFDARVDRFYSVTQLEQEIAAGRPVAISIAFGPGELSGSPIRSTDGHLIVVRGFTSSGDVIVNDPIAPNSKVVRLVYKREELGRIWQRSGGIVYLLSPRAGGPLSR